MIRPNEPYCSTINQVTNSKKIYNRKGSETAIVDYVAVDTKSKKHLQKVSSTVSFIVIDCQRKVYGSVGQAGASFKSVV